MLGPEELMCHLGPHPGPIRGRPGSAGGKAGRRIDRPDAFGHFEPERADITIDNPERDPQTGYFLEVAWGEVRPFQLLLSELGQRVQTAAEQRSHLLGGHRVAGGQAVDPVQAGTNPHSWRLAAFGVVGRQPGMTFLGRVQGRHLPGQVVIPGSRCELVEAHRHTHPKGYMPPGGQADPSYFRQWAPMSTARGSLDLLPACLGVRIRRGMWRVLSWEVGVVERRSEEQGVEAGSSATQLAARQSVVPLLRQPHPPL